MGAGKKRNSVETAGRTPQLGEARGLASGVYIYIYIYTYIYCYCYC